MRKFLLVVEYNHRDLRPVLNKEIADLFSYIIIVIITEICSIQYVFPVTSQKQLYKISKVARIFRKRDVSDPFSFIEILYYSS